MVRMGEPTLQPASRRSATRDAVRVSRCNGRGAVAGGWDARLPARGTASGRRWGKKRASSSEGGDGQLPPGHGRRAAAEEIGGEDMVRTKKRRDKVGFDAVIFYRTQYTPKNNTMANMKWAKDVSHAMRSNLGSGNSFHSFQTCNPDHSYTRSYGQKNARGRLPQDAGYSTRLHVVTKYDQIQSLQYLNTTKTLICGLRNKYESPILLVAKHNEKKTC